jgi:hypothetical protein
VLVAGLESLVNGGLDLTGLSLPCSESQLTVALLSVRVHNDVLLIAGVLTGWRRRC